jgi:parallel beta-helix repeat protein
MPTRPLLCVIPGVLFAATAALPMAAAGPIDPPAGPVASTPGPEPRTPMSAAAQPGDADYYIKITQPGSYFLTGNLTGVAGKYGIGIAAHGVTIDLNGFELVGVPNSKNGIQGIIEGIERTTILNGTVRDWGGAGIYIGSGSYGSSSGTRIVGVIAQHNGQTGITTGFFGSNAVVSNCVATANGGNGISVYSGCVVEACVATANGTNGIAGAPGSIIRGCSAVSNEGNGIYADLATVLDCNSSSNDMDGLYVTDGCVIRGNRCRSNGAGSTNDGANIHVLGNDNRIEDNTCLLADRGIEVSANGNILMRNICSGNGVNWEVVAGNRLLVVNAASSAAVSGNSGGTALGSTDPNANFTY